MSCLYIIHTYILEKTKFQTLTSRKSGTKTERLSAEINEFQQLFTKRYVVALVSRF